jgi:dephospho-CoA kinase
MMVIGLTGSIAMGKTEVAKIFSAEGLPIFDADHEVHVLYDSAEGAALLMPVAPDAIVDGRVDRSRLTAIVMADPEVLKAGEKRIHAEVAKRREEFVAEARANGHALAVVDIPLLFETGGDAFVDVTVVVSTPPHLQRNRALARPGMTPEKLEMILSRQMPDVEKRKRADYVIVNDGSLTQLKERTLAVLKQIKRRNEVS